jgi:hypothetical protein
MHDVCAFFEAVLGCAYALLLISASGFVLWIIRVLDLIGE